MPRRRKWRCIEGVSARRAFKPAGVPLSGLEQVHLTLDGLEALRLLDLEGSSQQSAAESLGVSRSTVSRLAAEARRTVAEALIEGKALVIDGGPVAVAQRSPAQRGQSARKRNDTDERGDTVVIAIPYSEGLVNAHFGRTEAFMVVEAAGGEVVDSTVYAVPGMQHDHGGLAGFLISRGVDVILAGGMGPPMQRALKDAGFSLFCGVSGSVDEAVRAYLAGELERSEAVCGHHEGHHHGDHPHDGGCSH